MSLMVTFLIFRKSSCGETLMVFTATRCPMYVPRLISANPPDASIVSETSILSVIIMESGSRPWHPASLLNVVKKACFSGVLRLCSAIPCGGHLRRQNESKRRVQLTWSKISIHNSASLRSRREIKVLPSLSAKIPANVRTALASSVALVTSFHNCW